MIYHGKQIRIYMCIGDFSRVYMFNAITTRLTFTFRVIRDALISCTI